MKEITVTQLEANQRLDKFLLKYFNKAPKSFVYKMFRKKRIKYKNGKAEGSEILQEGDKLQLYLSEETMDGFMEEKELHQAKRHFGIAYEDDNIIVVNKPPGLLSHPQNSSDKDTLIDQVLFYLYEKGQYEPRKDTTFTPALCNRLDRNTGGLVFVGKNLGATQQINKAIASHQLQKLYITMVRGTFDTEKELFGYHLKDGFSNEVKVLKQEVEGAKKIYTKVKPLAVKNNFSLLEIDLITGKSHQIRAHLKSMGFPVIGDRKYGVERMNQAFRDQYGLNNQFLFAYKAIWNTKEGLLGYLYQKEFQAKLLDSFETIKRDYFSDEDFV